MSVDKPVQTIRQYFRQNPVKGDVGIEIELEGDSPFPEPPNFWVRHEDGSLRGHAVEYVSDGPFFIKEVDDNLDSLFKCIHDHGVKIATTFRAGVHVHVNMQEASFEQVTNMACLYFIFEHALHRFCGANREGNLFCLRIEDAEAPIFFLTQAMRMFYKNYNTYLEPLCTDTIRYAAVNFASLQRHGTLEFRALESPRLSFESIKIWTKMLHNMKEYALTHPRIKYGDDFSFYGPDGFFAQVVGKDLAKYFTYDDFNVDSVVGMRNIQHLFYM